MLSYLFAIPKDPLTGANKIVKSYDGTGGWVYDVDNCILKINSAKWWNPYTWGQRLVIKLAPPKSQAKNFNRVIGPNYSGEY